MSPAGSTAWNLAAPERHHVPHCKPLCRLQLQCQDGSSLLRPAAPFPHAPRRRPMPQHGQVVLEPEIFLENLLADLRRPGRILVATHDNPDPDSLACALGLKTLFETELGRDTSIGFGGMVGRAENRALVEACHIPLLPLDDIRYADFASLALVDAQPDTGNNSIPPEVMLDLVVDHHP